MIPVFPDGELRCSRLRCRKFLGEVINDGQSLQIGASVFWNPVKFSCQCGKPFTWWPRPLETEDLTGEQREAGRQTRIRLAR
jgi:hypothetical protein